MKMPSEPPDTGAAVRADPAQAVAEAVRAAMARADAALRLLGIEITAIGPGRATAVMTVRADMLNGFGICHGGLIATLADSAFAYACNAYNVQTVAASFAVDLLAAAAAGDTLTAVAREVSRKGRLGLYDIDVTNAQGARIALFRGQSYTKIGRPVIAGGTANPAGG